MKNIFLERWNNNVNSKLLIHQIFLDKWVSKQVKRKTDNNIRKSTKKNFMFADTPNLNAP